jgi:dolichyl-phosphate-mannose-protein mannosyltransferase
VASPTDDFEQLIGAPLTPRSPQQRGSRLDDWFSAAIVTRRNQVLYRWGTPIAVTAIAAATRLWNLGHPQKLVFDETFYVKDGWSLVNLGYSSTWPDGADPNFANGLVNEFTDTGSYVVHPPLGKFIIGAGMALFGPESAASWRVTTALAGILAVALLFFIARTLLNSTLLGGLAGFLFAIDGNAIVMSRVALLDNYVMLFALAGAGAILLDRRQTQRRLDTWLAAHPGDGESRTWGPVIWARPWLITAGLAFGLCSAVKWSGFYFLAAFALYSVVNDMLDRRRAGIPQWFVGTTLRQAPASFLLTVPIALAAHMSTWITWFTTDGGYGRHWADQAANAWTGAFSWVPHSIQSWLHYQQGVYAYHVGEMRPHGYQANPLTWLFMYRPTSMYYQSSSYGQDGCLAESCGQSITGIANPLIWWAASAALVYIIYRLIQYRDARAGFVIVGIIGGYVPWLFYLNRTVFQFYTIAFEPYLILALTITIGVLLGDANDLRPQRVSALWFIGLYLVVAVALSVFFWPLWTGMQIDYQYMRVHWWLPSWL